MRRKQAFATIAHFNQHRAVTVNAHARGGEQPARVIRFHSLTKAMVVMLTLRFLPTRYCPFVARLRWIR